MQPLSRYASGSYGDNPFNLNVVKIFGEFNAGDTAILSMALPGGDSRNVSGSLISRGFLEDNPTLGVFAYLVDRCLGKSGLLKKYFPAAQIQDSPPDKLKDFMPKFHLVQALLQSGLDLKKVNREVKVYHSEKSSPVEMTVGIVQGLTSRMRLPMAIEELKRRYPDKNFDPPAASSSSSAEPVRVTDVADNFEQDCVVMGDS